MKRILLVAAIVLLSTPAEARRYGFTCGIFMAKRHGLDSSYALARNWLRRPRDVARPGVVVVQSRRGRAYGGVDRRGRVLRGGPGGHVSEIVQVLGNCWALVLDNQGTYQRNICRNLLAYVRP